MAMFGLRNIKIEQRLLSAFVICALASALSGCATIFGGTRQTVDFDSRPSGARLFINGDFAGITPVSVRIDQNQLPLIVLKKDGYADTRVKIEPGLSALILTDLALTPLVFIGAPIWGVLIDLRAGAARGYSETDIVIPLLPNSETRERKIYNGNVSLTNFSATNEQASNKGDS